jgi:hypothetical protein
MCTQDKLRDDELTYVLWVEFSFSKELPIEDNVVGRDLLLFKLTCHEVILSSSYFLVNFLSETH